MHKFSMPEEMIARVVAQTHASLRQAGGIQDGLRRHRYAKLLPEIGLPGRRATGT
jgi:hypothetical protein